jgi:hypothetical protein
MTAAAPGAPRLPALFTLCASRTHQGPTCADISLCAPAQHTSSPSLAPASPPKRQLLLLASQLEVQGVVRLTTNSPYCGLWFVAHAYDVLRGYPRAEALFSRTLPHLGCDQVR